MNVEEAPIVVLGLGNNSKPRAAVFDYQDKEAAKRAVATTGLKISAQC